MAALAFLLYVAGAGRTYKRRCCGCDRVNIPGGRGLVFVWYFVCDDQTHPPGGSGKTADLSQKRGDIYHTSALSFCANLLLFRAFSKLFAIIFSIHCTRSDRQHCTATPLQAISVCILYPMQKCNHRQYKVYTGVHDVCAFCL